MSKSLIKLKRAEVKSSAPARFALGREGNLEQNEPP